MRQGPFRLAACAAFLAGLGALDRIARAADERPKGEAVAKPFVAQRPVVIRVRGVILFPTQSFISRQIEAARARNADLVIFDIDSPGGDAQASMNIAEAIAKIDWARTAAFVENEALSGAAFAALGCEEILMRPDAKIGDAGPIVLGEDSMFRHAPEKIVSILAAEIRDVARSRGHPAALAVAMVDKDAEVFFFRNAKTGETLCMTLDEARERDDAADWQKGKRVPGSQKGRFLTLNGEDAKEAGLAAAVVKTFADVKERYGFQEDPPVFQATWVDALVTVLNSSIVTAILLIVALVCLYLELYTAGLGLFGIVSALCFALFFWSRFLGGTAEWLELLLFVGGLACLAIEIFVLPGFGVFGVTGVLLVLAGLTLASAPASGRLLDRFDAVLGSAATVGASLAAFLIVGAVLGRFLGAVPLVRRMALLPQDVHAQGDSGPSAIATSYNHLLNAVGRTRTPLRPAGKVRLDGADVDVVAEGAFIDSGKPVRVVLVQGNRIVVREIEES
jgi:membrane-bound serine protease (ClpP class)